MLRLWPLSEHNLLVVRVKGAVIHARTLLCFEMPKSLISDSS